MSNEVGILSSSKVFSDLLVHILVAAYSIHSVAIKRNMFCCFRYQKVFAVDVFGVIHIPYISLCFQLV